MKIDDVLRLLKPRLRDNGNGVAVLDGAHIVRAYARWAPVYDHLFGFFNYAACRTAVRELNPIPPSRILELGVGTGISLPLYDRGHRVVGIDLSPDMLERATRRVERKGLGHVEALHEMDARHLAFADESFDAAAAMFVITVVPETQRVLSELARVVKPGGRIVIVSHFGEKAGVVASVERWLARFAPSLGWNPGFPVERILDRPDLALIERRTLGASGFYTLLVFERI
jgi:phosphatidylethanolamine/phosphatidyl-N-methylethanolamine N-methyltransferase